MQLALERLVRLEPEVERPHPFRRRLEEIRIFDAEPQHHPLEPALANVVACPRDQGVPYLFAAESVLCW